MTKNREFPFPNCSKAEENFPRYFNFYIMDVADQVPGISEMVPLKSSID